MWSRCCIKTGSRRGCQTGFVKERATLPLVLANSMHSHKNYFESSPLDLHLWQLCRKMQEKDGKGYKKISDALRISVSTVQSLTKSGKFGDFLIPIQGQVNQERLP